MGGKKTLGSRARRARARSGISAPEADVGSRRGVAKAASGRGPAGSRAALGAGIRQLAGGSSRIGVDLRPRSAELRGDEGRRGDVSAAGQWAESGDAPPRIAARRWTSPSSAGSASAAGGSYGARVCGAVAGLGRGTRVRRRSSDARRGCIGGRRAARFWPVRRLVSRRRRCRLQNSRASCRRAGRRPRRRGSRGTREGGVQSRSPRRALAGHARPQRWRGRRAEGARSRR